ncbi:hypothetical protein B5M09_006008 [Aphanomyces astaci]|uniref:Cyclin-dependent kinase 2 homolog n=1 Tax=Aphanomyces astaci TaxID=112090 RepID=A0A3R7WH91_APHAT|nr:hypothetical protein B5M09_006008 [Aphanomyces astaci]
MNSPASVVAVPSTRLALPLSSTNSGNNNVLLAALGGTPRGNSQPPPPLSRQHTHSFFPGSDATNHDEEKPRHRADVLEPDDVHPPPGTSYTSATTTRRKRDRDGTASSNGGPWGDVSLISSDNDEEKVPIIDPSERVEHRSTKLVRREIVIASPSNGMDDDNDMPPHKAQRPPPPPQQHHLGFDVQPVDMILHVFSFLVYSDDVYQMQLVSKRWRQLTSTPSLWRALPDVTADGGINWLNFRNLGIKNKGTEGTCYRCFQRSTGRVLAMKRARVFPKGEGVPYYMLRELAVLQGIKHPHIASLEMISLAKDELHVFFPYVDKTLHEVINPTSDPSGGRVLPEPQVRRFLHQLLDAIAHCHRRGVLHRNLKPKHLLIDTKSSDELGTTTMTHDAELRISDFALVRATGIPRRTYTMEVVTLWYRPPEILMGVRSYSPAVDIWSIGCIFAEMAQGKPLFTGISEIDQLFQIFSKLATPTAATWPSFTTLPNYRFEFPNWTSRPWSRLFPTLSDLGLDLLSKLLTYDPDERISAENALRHPYFAGFQTFPTLVPSIPMADMRFAMRRAALADGGASNVQVIPEHIDLFHAYLRESEVAQWRDVNYLSRKRTQSLRPIHRSMLVDWLIEVVDVFEMCLRTAFLAVHYTDRYLDTEMVKKTKFQLLGATCLHVASKCEDVSYIGVEDLSMCADNVYTSVDVLKMEEHLLNTLNFTLSTPQLQAACGYSYADIKECLVKLQDVYSSAHMNLLTVVKKRYTDEDRCQVAQLLPPMTYNMTY